MEGFNFAELAALVGIFAAITAILKFFGQWAWHYLGLESTRQDVDRASLTRRLDKHEITTEGWYKELHARLSDEQSVRQAGDKELLAGLHRLEVDMVEKFATKGDLLASEARVIDAFNRNMDRREQQRGRGGQQ